MITLSSQNELIFSPKGENTNDEKETPLKVF